MNSLPRPRNKLTNVVLNPIANGRKPNLSSLDEYSGNMAMAGPSPYGNNGNMRTASMPDLNSSSYQHPIESLNVQPIKKLGSLAPLAPLP